MSYMTDLGDIKQIIKHGTLIPWWKRCQLVEEYHREKQRKNGTPQVGRPDSLGGKQGWGIRDTARELNLSIGRVHEELKLSQAIRTEPELIQKERKEAIERAKNHKK